MALYTETKTFFASKLNWLGILTFLAGATAKYADLIPSSALPYLTAVSGIAVVLLRTFGTSTAISGVIK